MNSSRILWIKLRFLRVKVCVAVGYIPNKGDGDEREKFWNDLDRVVDRLSSGYRLYVLGDLNGWIGDTVRVGITGTFGIP